MTKQCGACSKFMQAKCGALCKTCGNIYHKACLLMPESARVACDWVCPECKKKLPKGDNTPVKGVTSSYNDLKLDEPTGASLDVQLQHFTAKIQETIKSEMRSAIEEMMKELRLELEEVRAALVASNQRVESLQKRLDILEAAPGANDRLNDTITHLKLELNDREQELLLSDVEIANFPECSGENVLHTVGLVASKLGVALEPRDVVFAERVGYRKEAGGAARRIVVRLARRALRDDLLKAARARRGLTSADMGLDVPERRFYVNERLTRLNKLVFYRSKELGSTLGWKFIWTNRGRVLAKQAEGKPTYNLRSLDDFERVFGRASIGTVSAS